MAQGKVSFRLLALVSALALPIMGTASAKSPIPAAQIDTSPGIVSAADPRAVEAGVEILRQGGSATDAAIATMLALNVVEPQSSGIGGGTFLVASDSKTGAIFTIDGRETAPKASGPDWFLGPDGAPLPGRARMSGARSSGVPGSLATMAKAHAQSGKLPWASLFQPAIRLATNGFTVTPRMHNGLNLYGRHLTGWAKQTYFPDGNTIAIGTTLRVPELAQTFTRIARNGPKAFYRGPSAKRIAKALSEKPNHSVMTAKEITQYQAKDREPICGTYRVYKICGMGPPSSGGITVLMILKQLERFDLAAMGRNSPIAWHLFADSQRLAYADRDAYIADPDYISVPIAGLLDPTYLATRSALLSERVSLQHIAPGRPAGAPEPMTAPAKDDPGTTDLAVADSLGNVVSVTTTVNGYFGSGIAVDGYMLNNELPDFDANPARNDFLVANRVEGGKRPRSSMAPTIVYGPDGKVRIAIGAAGGATIIAQVAKALVGVLDWKMSAQDAIAMGLIFAPGTVAGTVEEGSDVAPMLAQLQALGQTLKVAPLGLKANAIEYVDGRWSGAADPRSEGVAMDTNGQHTVIQRRVNNLNRAHE